MVASAAEMTADQLFMSFALIHWGDYLTVPTVLDIPGLRAAFERTGWVRPHPQPSCTCTTGCTSKPRNRRRGQVRRNLPSRPGRRDVPPASVR
jgi:hypothetical protein